MSLHNRITQLRKSKELTQQHVADRLGVSRGAYANYEIGTREPDAETLVKLAELFDVSVDWLITGELRQVKGINAPSVPPEEREFLDWVKNNLEGTFFYDFSKAPEEQKSEMMRGLRLVWELEKGRKQGQKQGE